MCSTLSLFDRLRIVHRIKESRYEVCNIAEQVE